MSPRQNSPGHRSPRLIVSLLAFVWVSLALLANSEAMVCELEEAENMSFLQEPYSEGRQQSSFERPQDTPPEVRPQLRRAPADAGASCQSIFDEECDMGLPDGEPRPSSNLSVDDKPPCLHVFNEPPLETSATNASAFASHGERRSGYPLELFRPPPLR